MEDVSSLARPEELPNEMDGAGQAVAKKGRRFTEVLGDDGRALRRPRVIPRVREACCRLEENLELEEQLLLVVDRKLGEPSVAMRPVLAREVPSADEKIGVGVAVGQGSYGPRRRIEHGSPRSRRQRSIRD